MIIIVKDKLLVSTLILLFGCLNSQLFAEQNFFSFGRFLRHFWPWMLILKRKLWNKGNGGDGLTLKFPLHINIHIKIWDSILGQDSQTEHSKK